MKDKRKTEVVDLLDDIDSPFVTVELRDGKTRIRKRMGCLTRVMWALLAVALVLAVMILIQNSGHAEQEDRTVHQIKTEVLLPDVTPVPAPTAWVRYPVPLEDDLQRYIGEICREYGVPTELVLAVIDAESDHDPDAVGDSGQSYGLMRIWASEHTPRCIRLNCYNLFDPYQNVLVGTDFLAELWGDYGDWGKVLRFYHGESITAETSLYADAVMDMAEILAESAMVEVTV